MATKRFASHSDTEIDQKRRNIQTANTLKSNEKTARVLREYLGEKGKNTNFEDFAEAELAEVLESFYLDLRRTDGEKYKVNSLTNIRYGINRYLKSPPFNKTFDIIKDRAFQKSNDSFKSAMVELKREGKGSTTHHPVICENDLRKLYSSMFTSTQTPFGLMNKVQLDVRLYFFRRGSENMHAMTKTTFEVCTQQDGVRFVRKREDELTKNHREADRDHVTAIMPEIPGNPICPVNSFIKYLSKLNPNNNRLWQRALDSFLDEDLSWYCNIPVGVNTLQKFMPNLSKICGLSRVYTNHSIRATGATLLSKNKFGAAQIMSVTGHKSVASLAVYQRVGDDEKLQMGRALQGEILGTATQSLVPVNTSRPSESNTTSQSHDCRRQEADFPATQQTTITTSTATTNSAEIHLRGINMNDILCDFDQLPHTSHPMPIFHGCNITTLNIHYHNS